MHNEKSEHGLTSAFLLGCRDSSRYRRNCQRRPPPQNVAVCIPTGKVGTRRMEERTAGTLLKRNEFIENINNTWKT